MSLQDIVRWLIPREQHFYGFLERQADTAHAGAVALARFNGGASVTAVREAVQELEHDGDKIAHEMEEALAKTFVTPIDREDLHMLCTELDDILDLANGAIRSAALYGLEAPTTPMTKLIDLLVECTAALKKVVPLLRTHEYAKITEATHTLRRLEKQGDTIFRDAMSALFHDPDVDAKGVLRQKQVLEDLENAVDACEDLGETLASLAVKHA